MKGIRYTAEFKAKAIKQIAERGDKTADILDRLSSSINLKESIRYKKIGGGGGIRTRDRVAPVPPFQGGAFNRSATHPNFDT
jgi:transposase-like protein